MENLESENVSSSEHKISSSNGTSLLNDTWFNSGKACVWGRSIQAGGELIAGGFLVISSPLTSSTPLGVAQMLAGFALLGKAQYDSDRISDCGPYNSTSKK